MFKFSIRAYKHHLQDAFTIRMEYGWDTDKNMSILEEVLPRERFCSDKNFSKYVIDSLMEKARSSLIERDYGAEALK